MIFALIILKTIWQIRKKRKSLFFFSTSNIFYVMGEQIGHAVLMDLTINKENLFKLLEKAIKVID